jgi:hypothetical protein
MQRRLVQKYADGGRVCKVFYFDLKEKYGQRVRGERYGASKQYTKIIQHLKSYLGLMQLYK